MKELRALLPHEQDIVRKLAELKGNGENINLQKYQAGRVLEQIVGFNFAGINGMLANKIPSISSTKNTKKKTRLYQVISYCVIFYIYLKI